ncbi:MAG: AsmA-like C-terminal region-containing protein, partial [Pseudomonadota bacterium]
RIVFERDVPPLEQASGRIEFTENSAQLTTLSATFLGGPLLASAQAQRDAATRISLQGRVNADQLRKFGGPQWVQQLRGASDWRGSLTLRKKAPELVIESNLQGISSSLPAPFAKTAAETVALRIERRTLSAQQDRISVTYGDGMRAELLTRRAPGAAVQIERGVVRLGGGEVAEPNKPGVWVIGALKSFDFDEWLALIRGGDGDGVEAGQAIAGVDMKLAQVDFFGHRFVDLGVSGTTHNGVTQLNLAGREVEGAVTWRDAGKGRLVARLKKLTLASMKAAPLATSPKSPTDKSRELPALDVVVDQFEYGQKQLGKLELNAIHQERDWRIERLHLTSADSALTADGVWQGWLTQPRTRLNVRIEASDVGAALERWKLPAAVRRGTAKIEGHLAWAGSPHDFDYPSLSGEISVEAAKGQFLKLEPGLGKLLGILSLQALPRRVTLDFRDVFSDGFAFDGIVGAMKIERGIATTDNLRIAGPAARVVMSGDVDLARETQKLRVRVTPHLSDSVSLAGALLGGPVVGIAAFLAQKILKDPIEQLATFEYGVTGTWSDPQVL